MKNVNYNLVKLLHMAADMDWRIERHYLNDAKEKCESCATILTELHADAEKAIRLLREEVAKHGKLE